MGELMPKVRLILPKKLKPYFKILINFYRDYNITKKNANSYCFFAINKLHFIIKVFIICPYLRYCQRRITLKKILLSSAVIFLSACASNQLTFSQCPCTDQEAPMAVEPVYDCGCSQEAVEIVPEVIEVDPCKCTYTPDTTREILRPRIKEIVEEKVRRNCPKDSQTLNCGCGNCDTFAQVKEEQKNEVKEIVPPMPEAYELAASRVFNRFVKDTTEIYGAKPNVLLYLKKPVLKSDDLPEGIEKGLSHFKNKVLTSYTYAVTDDENNNDYVLETEADWFDTPSKTVPAIKYTTTLFDKNKKQIGQWVEIVKKADNSLKWL